jgi:hypothetical protein
MEWQPIETAPESDALWLAGVTHTNWDWHRTGYANWACAVSAWPTKDGAVRDPDNGGSFEPSHWAFFHGSASAPINPPSDSGRLPKGEDTVGG